MPLLNTEADLQSARQALMGNLARNCESRKSGSKNSQGEETTIFTRGDVCMELSSKGGLFVRPVNGDGGDYIGAGFGGLRHWQIAQENGGFILCHTLNASGETAQTVIDVVDDEFDQITIDHRTFFKICSTNDDDAFERITRFGLLCYQAGQPEERGNPPPPADSGCNPGPSRGGEKSSATWEARHYPLTMKIAEHLNRLGWTEAPSPENCRPDIFFEKCGSSRSGKILIEVKPDNGTHNVITAIGQLLCYRLPLVNSPVILVLATNGEVENNLAIALEHYAIKALDLAKDDWTKKLEALCRCAAPSAKSLKWE